MSDRKSEEIPIPVFPVAIVDERRQSPLDAFRDATIRCGNCSGTSLMLSEASLFAPAGDQSIHCSTVSTSGHSSGMSRLSTRT